MAGLIKRGKHDYAVYYVGGKERLRSLGTSTYQVAKERMRALEAALAGGEGDHCGPTPPSTHSLPLA